MKDKPSPDVPKAGPPQYQRPVLSRWGTLRELTQGGGGSRREPGAGGQRTRF